jgi:hypothetical protein
MLTIKMLVALASVIFGIIALFRPRILAKSAFLNADSQRGEGEIRASWGGLFIGLGVSVIILGDNSAYMVFGAAYAGAAVVRLVNALIVPALFNRTFYTILGFEVISAIIFFIPA